MVTGCRRWVFSSLIVCTLLLLSQEQALAQGGIGIRAGVGGNPRQLYFGAHLDAAEVVDQFWFRPNIEVGGGDSITIVGFNAEFAYFLPLAIKNRTEWKVYLGGGPGAVITDRRITGQTTTVGPGFNFLAGIIKREGLFAEIKAGVLDSPGFRFGIGWAWRR